MKFFLFFLFIFSIHAKTCEEFDNDSVWIWPKSHHVLTTTTANNLYLLQSNFSKKTQKFYRLGVLPHNINNKNIIIVIRLYSLPEISKLIANYELIKKSWEIRENKVVGLQLDFDSTTNGLKTYSEYLTKLRYNLSKENQLSITGLADWINGKEEFQTALNKLKINIFYQFYQGRKPHFNSDVFINKISHSKTDYSLGFLNYQNIPENIDLNNKHFKGIICFYPN